MSEHKNRLPAVLVSAALLLAGMAHAVSFPQFDNMSQYQQAEFIADMVARTEKALKDEGKAEFAIKMEQLFTDIEPGDKVSVGLAELEVNVARARLADLHRLEKDPKARRVDVEDALFVTLKKNGIELSSDAMNGVLSTMANFHPMTNAEFHARPLAEQRRIIRLFAQIAFPDYLFRNMVESKKKTFLDLSDENVTNLQEIVKTQFPASGEQPGFADVAADVEAERRKAPDHAGPFLSLTDYILHELQTRIAVHEKKLEERSVRLPDGRHVYHDDKDVFWVFPKDGAEYPLEANLQPLAQRLRRCMETGGIDDGPTAQTVCLEKFGYRNTSPAPSAEPRPRAENPPPAVPSTPPPDDDPIGGGGFISPPREFSALICVPRQLVDRWNAAAPNGKMAAFKQIVAAYVISVAQPGWQYWVVPGQFEQFNPAATGNAERIVSKVSPDSGRFDPLDFRCRASDSGYTVPVKR